MRDRGSMKIVLALVLSLAAVASAAAQGVVKLPIVAEITGGGASVGAMWRDAVNLAVEDINKKGGIVGMRLETSVQDTQTDPPTSVAVMRRVLNDKPFAIFGTVYSSSTVANMDIARQAGIPQFTGSESVIITQKGNDNIFLTSFGQDVGMAKMVRWLLDDLKAEKIALIWVNNAFGKGGRDMFVQFMKERGKAPVVDIRHRGPAGRLHAGADQGAGLGGHPRHGLQPRGGERAVHDPAPQDGPGGRARGRDHLVRADDHHARG